MRIFVFCTFLAIFVATFPAAAQQSFYNVSAAQPGTGVFLFRQTLEFEKFGDDPSGLDRDIEQFKLSTQLAYGLTKDLTVIGIVPLLHRDVDSPMPGVSEDKFNLGDAHVMLKYRVWQNDTGPIDTMRLGLLVGLDFPTGQDGFGNDGFDPMIGAVFTSIQDRHGFNASARFKFNTDAGDGAAVTVDDGIEDTLFLDAAYLYRLAPAEYAENTHGAWYAMIELNGTYETNGDTQLRLSPGIMYEARNWVIEAAVQIPVHQNLDHRPESDFVIGVGFRYLF